MHPYDAASAQYVGPPLQPIYYIPVYQYPGHRDVFHGQPIPHLPHRNTPHNQPTRRGHISRIPQTMTPSATPQNIHQTTSPTINPEDIDDDAIFGPVLLKPHAKSCEGFKGHETTLGLPQHIYRTWSQAAYDGGWMELAGVPEEILGEFTSKEKLEHLVLKGALHIGDELYVRAGDVDKAARVSFCGPLLIDSTKKPLYIARYN